jgi:hypothetical protein
MELRIDIECEHILWVVHDVLHAMFDCNGVDIYITGDAEKERIIDAFELCYNNELIDSDEDTYFRAICEQFSNRVFQYNKKFTLTMEELLATVDVTSDFYHWSDDYFEEEEEEEEDYPTYYHDDEQQQSGTDGSSVDGDRDFAERLSDSTERAESNIQ